MPRGRDSGKYVLMSTAMISIGLLTALSTCEWCFSQSLSGNVRSLKGWRCVHGQEYLRDSRRRPVWLSSHELMKRALEKQPIGRPSLLGKSGLQGDVTVQVLINASGKVECVRVVKGHPLAVSGAVECVSKWVFRPYTINGRRKSVLGILIIPYDFTR